MMLKKSPKLIIHPQLKKSFNINKHLLIQFSSTLLPKAGINNIIATVSYTKEVSINKGYFCGLVNLRIKSAIYFKLFFFMIGNLVTRMEKTK